MRDYEIKRGHQKTLKGEGLRNILEEFFGEVEEVEGRYRVSFGAIKEMTVWIDGRRLYIDTSMERKVDNETASRTIRAYNAFLEKATGFTAKQRRERLQKDARAGSP